MQRLVDISTALVDYTLGPTQVTAIAALGSIGLATQTGAADKPKSQAISQKANTQ